MANIKIKISRVDLAHWHLDKKYVGCANQLEIQWCVLVLSQRRTLRFLNMVKLRHQLCITKNFNVGFYCFIVIV